MRRKEDRAIRKHTLNLYAGDYEKLQGMYGNRVGAAKIIRDLVRAHIKRIEERAEQTALVDDLGIDTVTENI